MDIRQIAETYTHLGRLGRNLVGQPDADNEQTRDAKEQEQNQPPLLIPALARPTAEPACLNAVQARQLCDETSLQVEKIEELDTGLRVHDVSRMRLITPRYV